MTNKELKVLAIDVYEGRVFTDRHCNSPQEIRSSFMILALYGLDFLKEPIREEIETGGGLFYEYIDKALPMGVNGRPMFSSVMTLGTDDTKKMFGYYEKYKKLQDEFTGEDTDTDNGGPEHDRTTETI